MAPLHRHLGWTSNCHILGLPVAGPEEAVKLSPEQTDAWSNGACALTLRGPWPSRPQMLNYGIMKGLICSFAHQYLSVKSARVTTASCAGFRVRLETWKAANRSPRTTARCHWENRGSIIFGGRESITSGNSVLRYTDLHIKLVYGGDCSVQVNRAHSTQ